jgi:hypothetical protein
VSQTNVNVPPSGSAQPPAAPPPDQGMGYGVVIGVLVALVVLALLVYFLLIAPGNTVTPNGSASPSTGGSAPISTPSVSIGTEPSASPIAGPSAS